MSNKAKGPYKAVLLGDEQAWACIGNGKFIDRHHTQERAEDQARALNEAHNSALTSQAARVATLMSVCLKARNALKMCVPDATILIDELDAALTPKEPQP